MNGSTPPASPRPPASTARPRSAASAINCLQKALEGTRDRESYLAERVAASVGGVPDSLSDLRARALEKRGVRDNGGYKTAARTFYEGRLVAPDWLHLIERC